MKNTIEPTNTTTNQVCFYEGSYQFDSISTTLNISTDFIQMKLAKQFEYRPTNESLWAELNLDGKKSHWVLDYNNCLLTQVL